MVTMLTFGHWFRPGSRFDWLHSGMHMISVWFGVVLFIDKNMRNRSLSRPFRIMNLELKYRIGSLVKSNPL